MKKHILLKTCFAAVLFFAMCLPAFAGPSYVVGKLGGYTPESSDLTDYGFSTEFNGELAVGHYLSRHFAVELGVGHLQTSATFFDPTIGYFDEDIDATYIEGTAKLVFPIEYYANRRSAEPFMDFYVGGGGGVYFANDNADAIGFHQSDTVGGGHVLGGMDFNLGGGAFLGFEGKYIFVKAFQTLPTQLDGFIFTGNIGYKFY